MKAFYIASVMYSVCLLLLIYLTMNAFTRMHLAESTYEAYREYAEGLARTNGHVDSAFNCKAIVKATEK